MVYCHLLAKAFILIASEAWQRSDLRWNHWEHLAENSVCSFHVIEPKHRVFKLPNYHVHFICISSGRLKNE